MVEAAVVKEEYLAGAEERRNCVTLVSHAPVAVRPWQQRSWPILDSQIDQRDESVDESWLSPVAMKRLLPGARQRDDASSGWRLD